MADWYISGIRIFVIQKIHLVKSLLYLFNWRKWKLWIRLKIISKFWVSLHVSRLGKIFSWLKMSCFLLLLPWMCYLLLHLVILKRIRSKSTLIRSMQLRQRSSAFIRLEFYFGKRPSCIDLSVLWKVLWLQVSRSEMYFLKDFSNLVCNFYKYN